MVTGTSSRNAKVGVIDIADHLTCPDLLARTHRDAVKVALVGSFLGRGMGYGDIVPAQ